VLEKPVYPRQELVFVGPLDPDPLIAGDMFYDFFSAWVESVARRSSDVKIAASGSNAMPHTSRPLVLQREERGYRNRTYRLILRETQECVATIIGTATVDELSVRAGAAQPGSNTIILDWEPEGDAFVKDLRYMLHEAVGVPPPNWLEAPAIHQKKSDEAAEPQSGQQGDSREKSRDHAQRGMKLGTAERVREMHRLLKRGVSHRQAKQKSHCDPSTYYRWCLKVTNEEPILPYR
jgi:hypothetical protein